MAIAAVTCLGAALLVPSFFDFRDARGFAVVSITFYTDGLWLPLLALVDAARRRRRDATRPIDRVLAVASAAAIGVSLWAMLVEPNRLQVRHERVAVAAWAPGDEPFLIVHLSDLQTVGICAREREALRRVNELEPALIVVSGDYMAGPFDHPESGIAAARTFLAGLRARHGVVVVAGHSEPDDVRARIFEGLDLTYLRNEELVIDLEGGRRLTLLGLDVEEPSTASWRGREWGPRTARLVVSHVPDESLGLDGLGVDLHLAGHTHGGQIAIPGLGAPMTLSELPRKYARGLHVLGDHWLNVCAGLGMEGNHAPRIRLFCPPEFCAIELVGSEPAIVSPSDRTFR